MVGKGPGRQEVRVDEAVGVPPLELVEERIEPGVAEVDAVVVREQQDAVELECVQRVLQLRERRVDVR